MIIGVKYWARGSSAPGSWTNLHVAECYSTESIRVYDSVEAHDGEMLNFKRVRYHIRLVIDPFSFNHATYGPIVTALRKAAYCRVFDARYDWLETGDTVDFVVPGSDPDRSEASILTQGVTLEMDSRLTY
jgi:hypothetical protein